MGSPSALIALRTAYIRPENLTGKYITLDRISMIWNILMKPMPSLEQREEEVIKRIELAA